jgi:hypothetical protein
LDFNDSIDAGFSRIFVQSKRCCEHDEHCDPF